jgi:SAM-dependent methyltransferase
LRRGSTENPTLWHHVKTTTKSWDTIFRRQGRVFTEPHWDMPKVVRCLKESGSETVLDLGCGTGRHVVYLAHHGFSVYGLDNSPKAIKMTAEWLAQESLRADLQIQEMTETFPYEDRFFDAIVSIQVIHHADTASIKQIISEIERVLKPGGLLFVTVPKQRNQGKRFRQIEPNTFIPLDGDERGLPHHFFTPQELGTLLTHFEIADIHLDPIDHYCLSAYKQ